MTCVPKLKSEGRPQKRTNPPSMTLYIGNIPYETTDAELNKIFGRLDNITDIRIAVDRTTGWPRGFAHCEFSTVEAAQNAHKVLSETIIGKRQLVVDYSSSYKKDGFKPKEKTD